MPAPWRTSLVIGNPENRRIALWQAAVQQSGRPVSRIVSYLSLLRGDVDHPAALASADLVRIESPGENADVERELILRGARCADRDIDPESVAASMTDHGRIVHPGLWVQGYRDLLRELASSASRRIRWLNDPEQISLLFDKPACQQRLATAGIPVPRTLTTARSYDELRTLMRNAGRCRVFVKLPGGSSASGVVALSAASDRVVATTSAEAVWSEEGLRLYNSLRIRRYNDERLVAALIDALAADGPLHVEEWVPKAGFRGRTFDLRIVLIAGEPQHMVMRTSRGPLTNLHLGNRRGDVAALRSIVPPANWQAALQTCRQVGQGFPGCFCLGIDLAFTPGFRQHFVIEVNAFGDLLPGVQHEGRDTYAAQVAALCSVSGPTT